MSEKSSGPVIEKIQQCMQPPPPRHWLMKSEPDEFGIADLAKKRTTWWEGVRNYQARNFMRDMMKVGDRILFYHSNAEPSGVVGLATVSQPAAFDQSAVDPASDYHDPKSTRESPRWVCVQVKFERAFERCVTLAEMKQAPELSGLLLTRPGQRLSVMPVTAKEYAAIVRMAAAAPAAGLARGAKTVKKQGEPKGKKKGKKAVKG